jgi:uncharacterized protein YggE
MRTKLSMLLVIVLMVVAMPFAYASDKNTTITVQGSSQWDVNPDVAYINLAIVTQAATVAEAQSKNANIAEQVYKQLQTAGIEQEYIKTSNFNVIPQYRPDDGKRAALPEIQGYQVVNGLTVTVSPERAGEIIDLALRAGVNQVNQVRFGKMDEAGSKNLVLQMAMRDALSKAEALAAVLGKRIAQVQTVNESGVYIQAPEMTLRSSMKDFAQTPISPGTVHLNANVQLTVEIE